ncbi:MAG: imelysin family protein [Heliomarina sp.]|uniref:imelysin family protein n=1 Tax=Heliomarina sp. TaxID=2917556 RepID=UPI004059916C
MKHLFLALCAAFAPLPALADTASALDDLILPGFDKFESATAKLSAASQESCLPADVDAPYQAAFDAWMQVADLHMGPSETRALSIAFWPDARGFTPKSLSAMIADKDPVISDPEAFMDVSIAARGLYALDMLLNDPRFSDYAQEDYTCGLVRAIAFDLHQQAAVLQSEWRESFAKTLTRAGGSGNATYLSADEATRALYTQIVSGLEFTADTRLGSPLGTFERPRPKRAEAWRSGRSLRNSLLAVQAAYELAQVLANQPLPETSLAMDKVHEAASHIQDPSFQDISDLQARLRVEVLQQAVRDVKEAIETEVGKPLGIAPGFNSQDGD